MSEYRLPDPKVEPVKCLVLAYKVTKGINYENKTWDKVHYARCAKAAKLLLETCGSLRDADACLLDLSERFESSGFSWTLETVVRHAHDWAKKRRRDDGHSHRARFLEAMSKRPGSTNPDALRKEGGPLLDSLRSLPDLKKGDQKDHD